MRDLVYTSRYHGRYGVRYTIHTSECRHGINADHASVVRGNQHG